MWGLLLTFCPSVSLYAQYAIMYLFFFFNSDLLNPLLLSGTVLQTLLFININVCVVKSQRKYLGRPGMVKWWSACQLSWGNCCIIRLISQWRYFSVEFKALGLHCVKQYMHKQSPLCYTLWTVKDPENQASLLSTLHDSFLTKYQHSVGAPLTWSERSLNNNVKKLKSWTGKERGEHMDFNTQGGGVGGGYVTGETHHQTCGKEQT